MHLIDVHHHIFPPGYSDLAERSQGSRLQRAYHTWTLAQSLDAMDASGVATAITSISTPGTWFGDVAQARRLSRECNEYGVRIAQDHPGRFGSFASLPLPDIDGSLREIEYCADVLGVEGFVLMTNYDNRWPGEQEFAPVFDELNRRKSVVFFHPTAAPCCRGLMTDVPDATIEYMFDTVRAVTGLLYSGTFTRCPDIRFIFSHNGSAVPLLKNRISAPCNSNPKLAARLPNGPLHELQRLYYETAGATLRECFAPLLELVSFERILFGTDFPLGRLGIAETLSGLLEQGFGERELRLIARDNALGLFPRFSGAEHVHV